MYAGMCVCVDLGLANDALHYCAMLRHALTSESCCGFYSDGPSGFTFNAFAA